MVRLTYDNVLDNVVQKGCTLITTKEQFEHENLNCKSFYDIIGICGHPSKVKYDMFKAQNCGVKCKECTKKGVVEKLSNLNRETQDIAYDGYCDLKGKLSAFFHVEKMVEGTWADFVIKPNSVNDDMWLPIQLKTTQCAKAQYSNNISFPIHQDYGNMLITFVCLEPKLVLAIPAEIVSGMTRLKIGATTTKYEPYIVHDFNECFHKYYNDMPLQTFDEANTPRCCSQQREQEYRRKREQFIPYLRFEYPEREGLPYDFTINGFKVQEKVASIRNVKNKRKETLLNTYAVCISRGKKVENAYREGDNDFYWINIPDSTIFFLIPEAGMNEHGMLKTSIHSVKTSMVVYTRPALSSSNKHMWLHQYMFDYMTVPEKTIKRIFIIHQGVCNNASA